MAYTILGYANAAEQLPQPPYCVGYKINFVFHNITYKNKNTHVTYNCNTYVFSSLCQKYKSIDESKKILYYVCYPPNKPLLTVKSRNVKCNVHTYRLLTKTNFLGL